jgi:hypothetical protein
VLGALIGIGRSRLHAAIRLLTRSRRSYLLPVSTITDGVGLNITVISYLDHIDVGIIGDREQLEDPWAMVEGMQAALQEFQSLLSEDASAAAPPAEFVSV